MTRSYTELWHFLHKDPRECGFEELLNSIGHIFSSFRFLFPDWKCSINQYCLCVLLTASECRGVALGTRMWESLVRISTTDTGCLDWNCSWFSLVHPVKRWNINVKMDTINSSTHFIQLYEGHLQSSWTHLITPSRSVVEVRWRSIFPSTSLASYAFLTTLHPLLENVLQTVDNSEISCLGAPFSWLEKPRNRMGRDLDCMADVLMGFHRSTFSKQNTASRSGRFTLGKSSRYPRADLNAVVMKKISAAAGLLVRSPLYCLSYPG
jgi:hypothetical protein